MLQHNKHIEDSINAIRAAMSNMNKSELDEIVGLVDKLGIGGVTILDYLEITQDEYMRPVAVAICDELYPVNLASNTLRSKMIWSNLTDQITKADAWLTGLTDELQISQRSSFKVLEEENMTPNFSESFFLLISHYGTRCKCLF